MKSVFIVLFSMNIFLSCTSQVRVLKPTGETVTLELDNKNKYDGELFAVNDSVLFFESQAKLYKVPLPNVNNVYVHDFSLRKHKMIGSIPALIFWAIPFFVESDAGIWLYCGITEALTILSIYTGDPKVSFSPPLNNKDFDKLQLYCRYPRDLVSENRTQLLQYYGQKEFLTFQ